MTVESTVSRVQYSTNGTTGPFSVPFYFLTESDLEVVYADSTGSETPLVLSTDYSVTGEGDPAGGSITTTTAYAAGGTITIRRVPSLLQQTDYTDTDRFPAAAHETALDRAIMGLQYLKEITDRCIQIPVSGGESVSLPDASDRAGKTLTFDASGNVSATAPADGSAASLAADLLNYLVSTKGVGMVGWSPNVIYGDNTAGKKLAQHVHVEDHGAAGDGLADDSAAIDAAMVLARLRGLPVRFDGTKNYRRTSAWTIAANDRLETNGATFTMDATTTSNTAAIDILAGARIDELRVVVPTGVRRDRCVRATGDDVQIGKIVLTSTDVQTTTEADDAGVIIRNGSRMWIGMIDVTNYDRGVIVTGTTDSAIGRVNVTGYVRGLYAWDNVNLRVIGGHIKTRSVNGAESPGHNGLLLACTAPASQRWCRFENLVIENAGEHAIRLGGDSDGTPTGYHEHIWITEFAIYDCNGCGVKILGTDAITPTARNKSIWLSGVIEDAGRGVGAGENRCGVLVQHADHVYMKVRVLKRDQTYSCTYPVYLDSVGSVTLDSCTLNDGSLTGLAITCANGSVNDIVARGTRAVGNGSAGFALTVQAAKSVAGLSIDMDCKNNGNLGFIVTVTGTVDDALLRLKTRGNTNGAGSCNSASVGLDVVGSPGATPIAGITAMNSSMWRDGTNTYIRKAGAWVAL